MVCLELNPLRFCTEILGPGRSSPFPITARPLLKETVVCCKFSLPRPELTPNNSQTAVLVPDRNSKLVCSPAPAGGRFSADQGIAQQEGSAAQLFGRTCGDQLKS